MLLRTILLFLLISLSVGHAQETKLGTLNFAYASATPRAAYLWIAKDHRLFEKYGLNVNLVSVRGSATTMQTLLGGDVDLIYVTGAAAVTAAARGAPVVIIATSGNNDYKILTQPAISSLQQLKGKIIGISNPAGSDYFALRRMLPKLGLVPGKDVSFLTTGIQSSIEKVLLVLEGRIHATLGSADTVALYEMRGQRLNVLADAVENGVYVTSGDIAARRQFLKENPAKVKAFLKAMIEAMWIAKKNPSSFSAVLRKYLKLEDPKLVAIMHKNNALDYPSKPFPSDEAIKQAIEDIATTSSDLKLSDKEFTDTSLLKEIDKEGFFAAIQR